MKVLESKLELIDGKFHQINLLRYSDNKIVKRIYNINGQLVDAIPIKNYSNSK
jgi:hypothetical protein